MTKRKAPPWVKFYADDWLAGTFELSVEARGAYITICSLMWSKGGAIVDDDRTLARYCNVSIRTWPKIKSELIEAGKMTLEGGLIEQERALDELAKSILNSNQQRLKSISRHSKIAGNQAKSLKTPVVDHAAGQPNQNQNQKEESLEPFLPSIDNYKTTPALPAIVPLDAKAPNGTGGLFETFPTFDKLKRAGRGGRVYPPAFEMFIAEFPCRATQSKKRAYTAWRKATTGRAAEALVVDAHAYRVHCEATDTPAQLVETWVNGEGWGYSLVSQKRAPPPTLAQVNAALSEKYRRDQHGDETGSQGGGNRPDVPALPQAPGRPDQA